MIITTIQDANAANCCPCDWPECADPRKECESVTSTHPSLTGLWHPFEDPGGPDEDEMPALYQTATSDWTLPQGNNIWYNGTQGFRVSAITDVRNHIPPGGTSTYAAYTHWGSTTFTNSDAFSGVGSFATLDYVLDPYSNPWPAGATPSCSTTASGPYTELEGFGPTTIIVPQGCERTATTMTQVGEQRSDPSGSPLSQLSCPGPWGDEDEHWNDVVATDPSWMTTLSDSITKSGLIADTIADLPSFEDGPVGSACHSSTSVGWPTLADGRVVEGEWPPCPQYLDDAVAGATVIKSRYRFGVPAGYSTVELPRTTWEMTWDEVFASVAWWAWYDGGMEGAAPDASLALVTARDWTWAGDMESPWSDWYEIPVPETPGETRGVNVMIICWRSSRLGDKPTYYGDQVALPE